MICKTHTGVKKLEENLLMGLRDLQPKGNALSGTLPLIQALRKTGTVIFQDTSFPTTEL